jgi:hypothetical protein
VKFYRFHQEAGRGGPVNSFGLLSMRPPGASPFEELTCILLGKLSSPRQIGLYPNQGSVDIAGPT